MTLPDDTDRSMRSWRDASSRLARLLDRAVVVARAGQLLEFIGRVVVAATLAILAIPVLEGLGLRVPFPVGPIMVAVAMGIAAWLGSRRWKWPDRLTTAMALERAHPRIGERISRAVAFIGGPHDAAGPPADHAVVDLMGEALDEAATAVEALAEDRSARRHAVRAPLLPLRWPAAGLASLLAVAIGLFIAPGRLVPPLADAFLMKRPMEVIPQPSEGETEPASVLPKSAVAAAARLAEAAATEERLAIALLARFARAPGGSREGLTRGEQDWLDETASLQAAIADDLGRNLETVVEAVQPNDPRLAFELACRGLVRECAAKLASAAKRIRENQLAAASGLITSQVRPILAALRECGVVPSGKIGPAFDREELVQRRILSVIEPDGDRPSEAVDAAATIQEGTATDLASADVAGRPPTSPVATTTADRAAPAAGGTTGTGGGPGAGSGASRTDVVVTDADSQLPAWVRAREERPTEAVAGDGFSAPPRYRQAIDDYYRRLWAAESPRRPALPTEHKQEAAP